MKPEFSEKFRRNYDELNNETQNKFDKQLRFLVNDLRYPSLHAKKVDETKGVWQARVDRDWRFYFKIEKDSYILLTIIRHPK